MPLDLASLRRLAQAANHDHDPATANPNPKNECDDCNAYEVNCSPDVVLALLAEVERLSNALMKYGSHARCADALTEHIIPFQGCSLKGQPCCEALIAKECDCGLDSTLTGGI